MQLAGYLDLLQLSAYDGDIECVVKPTSKGFEVWSKDRKKRLGGPYKTRERANRRIRQIEWFKQGGIAHFNKGRSSKEDAHLRG